METKLKARDPNTATRERLMDVAERLFAEAGYGNVSTRTIADEAHANTAAVHYHFGSKENLLEAVLLRRLEPMNLERVALIQAEMERSGGKPSVESILRAFLEPTLRKLKDDGDKAFRLLSGRASTDPNPEVRRVLFAAYDTVARAFAKAIAAACPDLSEEELFWRVACVYGAMLYIRADNGRLNPIFGGRLSLSDSEGALRYAIPFLTAGMSAKPIKPDN
jgi:AcrR family transcriptional regulator